MIRSLIIILILVATDAQSQEYTILGDIRKQIQSITSIADTVELQKNTELLWHTAKTTGIPIVAGDSVYFLYRGEASTVEWVGDFNGWGFKKEFDNKGKRISNTDIWLLKTSFPKDARLDYKILINGNNWILDPENKFQQWSGVGGGSPNSELRMPDWKEDPILTERNSSQKGSIERDIIYFSKKMGYQISYSVYLPYQYDASQKYPVIYVTDGYEYIHPKLGNMIVVLDNLIADHSIKPLIAVFIDHREPINRANNRRMQELGINQRYLEFVTEEFVPHIESIYSIISKPEGRAVMGTSMGGLTATYFTFSKPEIFGMAGVQSPAFYIKPQIYTLCTTPADPSMKISMTAGLINDTSNDSRKMNEILEANTCIHFYREVNEGHSWGNWKRLIDDILIDLFGIN